jgi:hypothetical protein
MSPASGPGSPSWLPLLDSIRVYSYFIGLWMITMSVILNLTRLRFLAASSVVVAYDWGEQYNTAETE